MSFKDILSKFDQLSEAETKETEKGRVHKGDYGRHFDTDEEGDEKKKDKAKADAPKRGRGRPKKDSDDSGEVKKYDTKHLHDVFGGGKKPKKEVGKTSKKHSLKEYFEEAESNYVAETLAPGQKPIPVVGKQGDQQSTGAGFLNINDTSPTGQALQKALSDLSTQKKVQIVMPTAQQAQKPQSSTTQPTATSGGATQQPAMAEEGDKWIQKAVKHPGSFTAKAKKAGKSVAAFAKEKAHAPGTLGKQARLAQTLRKMHESVEGMLAEGSMEDYSDLVIKAFTNKATGNAIANVFDKGGNALTKSFPQISAGSEQEAIAMQKAAIDKKLSRNANATTGASRIYANRLLRSRYRFTAPLYGTVKKDRIFLLSQNQHAGLRKSTNYEGAPGYAIVLSTQTLKDAGFELGVRYKVEEIETGNPDIIGFKCTPYERIIGNNDRDAGNIPFVVVQNVGSMPMREGDIPPQDGLLGAGLGAGRSETFEAAKPDFLDLDKDGNKKESMKKAAADKKKKKVDESMDNKLKAAHHAGKSHALSKQSYNCHYDDMEEARMYHEGYKEGLDECYGQVPMGNMMPESSTVDDMASFGAHTPALDEEDMYEMDKTEWMKHKAKATPGDTFKAFGQTFNDKDVLETNSMFESWDNQLNSLLTEYSEIQEGLTVSVSKGQQGMPDSVSVNAQDGDADKLLQLVKHAGLGLFGDDAQGDMGVPSGDEDHGGVKVVGDHDGMMALIKKVTGADMGGGEIPGTLEPASSEDYADEEGEEEHGHEEHEHTDEETCNECGMYESQCECEPEESLEEVESEDQMTAQVAEEDEKCDDCGKSPCECEDEHEHEEDSDEDEEEDEEEQDLDESYANSPDDGFEADIEYMTKMISGGLNKQKSTGQTTAPVIAGQNDRMGYEVNESLTDWKKLAGLK